MSFFSPFIQKANAIVKKDSTEKDHSDESLIVLEGCNQITKWHFPKDIKNCPVHMCDFSCSSNSACRNHFKKIHAKHSICCPECNKPYVSIKPHNFLIHFRKAHPSSQIPFNLDQSTSFTVNKENDDNDDESDNNADDDIITLNGCGITTKWRLPAGCLKCPVLNCQQSFEKRSNLVCHYKENHAKRSILCKICDKPLRVSKNTPTDYINHYNRLHPNHNIPFNFANRIERMKKIIRLKSMV